MVKVASENYLYSLIFYTYGANGIQARVVDVQHHSIPGYTKHTQRLPALFLSNITPRHEQTIRPSYLHGFIANMAILEGLPATNLR